MIASRFVRSLLVLAAVGIAGTAAAQDYKLRLITWADYVRGAVIAQFKKKTGIDVEFAFEQ
jgi:spermidine/putrescine transport system substrate-binding protein